MDDSGSSVRLFRFAEYEADVCSGQLRRSGQRIRLQEQPFQVLLALLKRSGEVVTRDELRAAIWPEGTYVDFDHGLNTAVKKIRSALGDNASVPRYVETIPRRGYRFLAIVETTSNNLGESKLSGDVLFREAEVSVTPQYWRQFRWPFVLCALTALMAASIYFYWHSSRRHSASSARVTVVVLPFENMSGDPAQDYLCEGFSEELATHLGRIDPTRIAVVARVTAVNYAHNRTIAEIGRDLHVDYVLEGSVREDQERVRISAQLIRVRDQSHIWANEFDRELDNVLAVQTDVASVIAEQVRSSLSSG